jgi:hypothetical protein
MDTAAGPSAAAQQQHDRRKLNEEKQNDKKINGDRVWLIGNSSYGVQYT